MWNKKLQQITVFSICAVLAAGALTGCGQQKPQVKASGFETALEKYKVAASAAAAEAPVPEVEAGAEKTDESALEVSCDEPDENVEADRAVEADVTGEVVEAEAFDRFEKIPFEMDDQGRYNMWYHGVPGKAFFEYDGKGNIDIIFVDPKGIRQCICGWVDDENPGPYPPEEEREQMEDLFNMPEVEFSGGLVTIYFQDQVVDITDKFVDGMCELTLRGYNRFIATVEACLADESVSMGGYYDETPTEEELAEMYSYKRDFGFWARGKKFPASVYYNADGEFEVFYTDEEGNPAGPGGTSLDLQEILNEKGADYYLTEEDLLGAFNNDYEISYNDDGTVILYYQDQIIDITDRFIDGVCDIHVTGRPHGWYITVEYGMPGSAMGD